MTPIHYSRPDPSHGLGNYFLVLALVILTSTVVAAEPPGDFFVATDGNDADPGTLEKPFATLARARDAVRQLKTTVRRPITVVLRGGTYYLGETVVFTAEDSGTKQSPIVYRAFEDEEPVISGGLRLRLAWRPYRGRILQAEVPAGTAAFDQLFLNGRRQRMARYPNYDPHVRYFGGFAADCIGPERVRRWSDPVGAFVHALHAAHWGGLHYRITGVDEQGRVTLEGGYQNNRRTGMHKTHRFVENVFEELDAPGEWFFDGKKSVLYCMPPEGIDLNRATSTSGRRTSVPSGRRTSVQVARLRHLIELRGTQASPVRFITFKGLTLTHTLRTFMDVKEPLLRSDWCIYRGGAVLIEGAEDCTISEAFFDAVGGNAVFISNYNRRIEVTGCKITEAGGNGVCLVGDPGAVRSPSFEYGQFVPLEKMDRTPGPKTDNYPARCRVHDNLIHSTGQVEKQTAAVQISMAEEITVSHNSIYHVPRAGINISEGTWGGHVIEYNDVFDTVRETGDHGSLNSWGRDRFWHPNYETMSKMAAANPEMPKWDARKTTILRNNRFRCDHGWDIDLDDGSSNYRIVNNLCLNGGIKLREGFYRTVENNIMLNNSFHPHVWFNHSGDVFVRNIVSTWYRPIRVPHWGQQVDYNLLPDEDALQESHALGLDAHSLAGDPMFVAAGEGNYQVQDGSPAMKLGFQNFAMDQFGVMRPQLRAEALSPRLPHNGREEPASEARRDGRIHVWLGAKIKNVVGMGEVSASGLRGEIGVLVVEVPAASRAARFGLHRGDVVLKVDGQAVHEVANLLRRYRAADPGGKVQLGVFRNQKETPLEIKREMGSGRQ